jgi:hypothetical protein
MTVRTGAVAPTAPPKEIYIPLADRGIDFTSKNSKYSNFRKAETPDVVLFWDKFYGDDPTNNPDLSKRFNVKEVLAETQRYYDYYVNVLKFVEKGNSVTDKYKAIVYVTWNEGGDNGTAFGGGADNKIGVFWTPASRISKGPYGVIAHELGHSFQSLVQSDGNAGLRGPVWEMTSQYMLWQVLPEWMTFENYHLKDFMKQTHLAFLHEDNAYHSPYVLEYWSNRRGLDFVGKIWRQALPHEDMVMAYKRLTNLDQKAFNDEMFDAARHFITWDMARIEKLAAPYANQHTTALDTLEGGWYRIAASKCPQTYGYNGIPLQVPPAGTEVTLNFKGIAGAQGYRAIQTDKAGWRYGFVASKADGSREYSPISSATEGSATFTVPEGTKYLWMVVSGAPTEHFEHMNDNDATTDEQWPYQFQLVGTSPDPSVLDLSKRDAALEKKVADD